MRQQKFHCGDLVMIKPMPGFMSHFCGNCEAVVRHSYDDLHFEFSEQGHRYGVFFSNGTGSAWYYEDQLTLIEKGRFDLYEEFKGKCRDKAPRLVMVPLEKASQSS